MKHIASAVLAENIAWGHVRLPRSECRDPRSFIKYLSFVWDHEPFVQHSLLLLKITWILKAHSLPKAHHRHNNAGDTLCTMESPCTGIPPNRLQPDFLASLFPSEDGFFHIWTLICMDIYLYGIYFYGHPTGTLMSADSQDSMLSQKHIWKLAKTYAPSCHAKLTN